MESAQCTFRGSFTHTLDAKGRLSIPAQFRASLAQVNENTIVVTNYICDGARCLDALPLFAWRELERKLFERSRFDAKVRKLENYYLARAAECPLDPSGRINLPAHLIAYAGLEKEIVFTSTVRGFRLWDNRVWDLIFKEAETALLDNPDVFTDVDL